MRLMNFVLIISLLTLSSCGILSGKPKPQEITKITNKSVSDPALNLPFPEPIEVENVEYIIITPDNATETFAKLLYQDINPALFCLTDNDYTISSNNHDNVQKYIVLIYETLESYKKQYDKPIVGEDVK